MFKPIYFDYMATTPIDPRVAKKMQLYLTDDSNFGNSGSQHFYGRKAKAAIEQAAAFLQYARGTGAGSDRLRAEGWSHPCRRRRVLATGALR